jgi:hypothetical protein
MRASSWNQISIGFFATPARWALSMAGKFFKSLDRARVLHRVTRAGADVGEAEPLEELADRALVIGDREALQDDALEIDAPPTHDAVHGPVRTGLDELCELSSLLLREPRLATFGPVVEKAIGAVFVEPVNPVAQRLAVHPADPGRLGPVHPVQNRSQRQETAALVGVLRCRCKPPKLGR